MLIEWARHSPFNGSLDADESYFDPLRVRGKRGRGSGAKTIVFGLLKRDGTGYAEIAPNITKAALRAVIRGHADLESVIHTEGWSGYDGLVDLGYERHHRVNHGNNEFAVGPNHSNGIESFWRYAKHRLTKFHRVNRNTFPLLEGNRISSQSEEKQPLQSPAILAV